VDGIGVLLLGAVLGAFMCARARSAGGAAAFSLVALALFIATPAGAGVPGAVADFVDALNSASTPVLTEPVDGPGAVG
jgi:hypothetical protein